MKGHICCIFHVIYVLQNNAIGCRIIFDVIVVHVESVIVAMETQTQPK